MAPTSPAVRVRITMIRTPKVGIAGANRSRVAEPVSTGHAMRVIQVTLVPHTHWDREWYEPFSVFSERLVAMMDVLLDLAADGFPHFHLDGQTAMIDDYLERRPERADELERHVRAGRLSAGPWVTQMDEFLTSGESHIRNLEMGLERAEALGGALRLGYMPDQFGHIGQMPQILRKAGLDRAMVWRGVPREVDRTAFRWRAPDGSEVLTEYMAFGYFNGGSLDRTVDPEELADTLAQSIETMRPYIVDDAMVVMVGYDHADPTSRFPAVWRRPGATFPRRTCGSPASVRPWRRGTVLQTICPCGTASCGRRHGPTCCPTSTRRACIRSANAGGSRPSWSASPSPWRPSCLAWSGPRGRWPRPGP